MGIGSLVKVREEGSRTVVAAKAIKNYRWKRGHTEFPHSGDDEVV